MSDFTNTSQNAQCFSILTLKNLPKNTVRPTKMNTSVPVTRCSLENYNVYNMLIKKYIRIEQNRIGQNRNRIV